ncbi:MAG: hypothetical protein RL341_271 [Pseudomonadota bacterium]
MATETELADAKKRMQGFIVWLLRFLQNLIYEPYYRDADGRMQPLLDEALRSRMQSAWVEFARDFEASSYRTQIDQANPEYIIAHGLYGAQLNTKLWMICFLLERLSQDARLQYPPGATALPLAPADVQAAQAAARRAAPKRKPGAVKRAFQNWFKGVDVFLDSVIAATGMDGAIKEIKELFGLAVDEGLDAQE